MSSFLTDTFAQLSRRVARGVGHSAGAGVDRLRRQTVSAQSGLRQAYEAARQVRADTGQRADQAGLGVLRAAAAGGPAKEVAKICGRAGAAGAIVDGAVGGLNAYKYMRQGRIDGSQAAKHVAAETGCGFVTSASGTAGTIAIYMVTGSMGPAALAAGMGASIGSRYVYRQIVGETLPDDAEPGDEDAVEESEVIEEIGPRPSGE